MGPHVLALVLWPLSLVDNLKQHLFPNPNHRTTPLTTRNRDHPFGRLERCSARIPIHSFGRSREYSDRQWKLHPIRLRRQAVNAVIIGTSHSVPIADNWAFPTRSSHQLPSHLPCRPVCPVVGKLVDIGLHRPVGI